MTDEVQDPLSRIRGIAAFSKGDPYQQLFPHLRKPHWEAAERVLRKAGAVLRDDPARAAAYVDTALRLPYDEDEQQEPAALQAHMLLFTLVSDAAEQSEQDDPTWLDAAIEVMEGADPAGQVELRVVLDVIGHDYQLPASELRRLRRAVDRVAPAPTLNDEDFPGDQLKDRILVILEICERYEDAFDEHYYS